MDFDFFMALSLLNKDFKKLKESLLSKALGTNLYNDRKIGYTEICVFIYMRSF